MSCLELAVVRLGLYSDLLVDDVFAHQKIVCFVSQVTIFC